MLKIPFLSGVTKYVIFTKLKPIQCRLTICNRNVWKRALSWCGQNITFIYYSVNVLAVLIYYKLFDYFPKMSLKQFLLFIFCWRKEGRACLIAQRQWILRYDILKNKKFHFKTLIPKISEEFTIVITWPLQMFGLNGSRYAPDVRYFSV